MKLSRKYLLLLVLALCLYLQAGGICWSQVTERVSVDSSGTQATGASNDPSTSSDGRYVAFESFASDLVVGDGNGKGDIFVRDRQTDTTTRVSVATGGGEGNGDSSAPSISEDGRYVAFESVASDLVLGDVGGIMGFRDIFVHDRQTGTTTRVSLDSGDAAGDGPSFHPSISSNGRFVAFDSDADLVLPDVYGVYEIFVRDRQTGTTTRVSVDSAGAQGNGHSYSPSISGDGRYVAFESSAPDLVAVDTNTRIDIFVRDRQTPATTRVSVASGGGEGNGDCSSPSISADGRFVAFVSDASNLVADDTLGFFDVFVHDRQTGTTTRVSVDSAGDQGNGHSYAPSLSADGRYVAFYSEANNLVAGDTNGVTDIFVRDLQLATTRRVGLSSTGGEAIGGGSSSSSYSADAEYVAFESSATNLVAGDTNGSPDVFIRESMPPTITTTGPADNTTDVAVDSDVTATFSEQMDDSTINGTTFTLDNGATGLVSYDANSDSAIFTPTSNLDYDTTYTATVTTVAEDVAGNALEANHSWSFTTQAQRNSSSSSDRPCFIATAADGFGW